MPNISIYLTDEHYDFIRNSDKKPTRIIRLALEKYIKEVKESES